MFALPDTGREYVIYFQSGRRSVAAAFLFAQRGFKVALLKGGLWAAAKGAKLVAENRKSLLKIRRVAVECLRPNGYDGCRPGGGVRGEGPAGGIAAAGIPGHRAAGIGGSQ